MVSNEYMKSNRQIRRTKQITQDLSNDRKIAQFLRQKNKDERKD